ncbi:MAG: ABC transporter ATP-binding protein [Parachlamydiales bacterium]|jgi:lipoprotein-releasing system ATP-binding protein
MNSIVLECKNLHKKFHNPEELHLLKGIDLTVKRNQSVAIMGSSGIGKTTLLHIFGHLESFESGSLKILHNKKLSDAVRNKHIGFIFQTYNLLEDLSLLENVLMPAYIGRKDIKKNSLAYKRAIMLLKEVGLENRKDYLAKDLSGGEKQRAAIARAFCNDPDLILADEPSGNLDDENSKIIHNLLVSSVKKFNKSLIVATHDKQLASLCDQVYLLKDGKISLI